MTLPDQYNWLTKETGPKMLVAALKYYGLKEVPGSADNPTIMKWAHDFGITWYEHDSIAWCSLFMGQVAKDAGYAPPNKNQLLAAVSWTNWGRGLANRYLGAIMVFNRPGGHHVGLYIGEDNDSFYVLGGNTGDAVAIARIAKGRLIAIRWPNEERLPDPNGRKEIILASSGALSQNEA